MKDLRSRATETPEPEVWLARLDEVERWPEYPAELASRLVSLLVTSKHESLELHEKVIEAAMAGEPEAPNIARFYLVDRIVCVASWMMIALGPPAREALLRAYAAAGHGSKERRWFLITLSRMGDPALEPFFDRLKADDFDAEQMHDPVSSFRSTSEYYCAMNSFRLGGVEAVYAAVQHKRQGWRAAAIHKLSGIGDERAIQALRSLLNDPVEAIRASVRYKLAWIEQKRNNGSGGVESD
jgi:hypothetical protein